MMEWQKARENERIMRRYKEEMKALLGRYLELYWIIKGNEKP